MSAANAAPGERDQGGSVNEAAGSDGPEKERAGAKPSRDREGAVSGKPPESLPIGSREAGRMTDRTRRARSGSGVRRARREGGKRSGDGRDHHWCRPTRAYASLVFLFLMLAVMNSMNRRPAHSRAAATMYGSVSNPMRPSCFRDARAEASLMLPWLIRSACFGIRRQTAFAAHAPCRLDSRIITSFM